MDDSNYWGEFSSIKEEFSFIKEIRDKISKGIEDIASEDYEKYLGEWQKIRKIAREIPIDGKNFTDYQTALTLQKALDAFYGKLPRVVQVVLYDSPNDKPQIWEIPIEEYIKKSFSAYKSKEKEAKKAWIKEVGTKQKIALHQHEKRALYAYMGTKARLERYREIFKKSSKSMILMWQEQKDWILAYVNNYGDVDEAYVAALHRKHKDNLDALCKGGNVGSQKYYSHELISSFFTNYIVNVDTAGPVRGEDVETDEKQIAVKNLTGEKWGLSQYAILALAVWINKTPPLSYEELLESQSAIVSTRNKILGKINTKSRYEFEQTTSKELKDYLYTNIDEIIDYLIDKTKK